jgi:hypothetical protein
MSKKKKKNFFFTCSTEQENPIHELSQLYDYIDPLYEQGSLINNSTIEYIWYVCVCVCVKVSLSYIHQNDQDLFDDQV